MINAERTMNGINEATVASVLSELTERQREVFCLYYGIGDGFRYEYQEIGRRFSRSATTARNWVDEARREFRRKLEVIAKECEARAFDAAYDIRRYGDFIEQKEAEMRAHRK